MKEQHQMENIEQMIDTLKDQLIDQLNLEDLTRDDIQADDQLFGGELGLDSIDALEIIVLLEKEYGLRIENQEEGKKIFQSIRSIAEYIQSHK